MLTDEPAVLKTLLRMVVTLEENVHAREDLLQEATDTCMLWTRIPARCAGALTRPMRAARQQPRTSKHPAEIGTLSRFPPHPPLIPAAWSMSARRTARFIHSILPPARRTGDSPSTTRPP